MNTKIIDYLVATLTVAGAALLISMLWMDIAQFESNGIGHFILNTDEVTYCWPSGQRVLTESIWWMKPGLVCASVLLFIPLVIHILKKNMSIFLWINVGVLLSVIIVENMGISYGTEQIEGISSVDEVVYLDAFFFPYYAFGISILAALLYTFFGKKKA